MAVKGDAEYILFQNVIDFSGKRLTLLGSWTREALKLRFLPTPSVSESKPVLATVLVNAPGKCLWLAQERNTQTRKRGILLIFLGRAPLPNLSNSIALFPRRDVPGSIAAD